MILMGGPGCRVLLSQALSPEHHQECIKLFSQLGELKKQIYEWVNDPEEEHYDLQITDANQLGVDLSEDGSRPFMLVYGELTEWGEAERKIVQQKTGFDPMYMIKLDACCSDEVSHRLLGLLTLEYCERFHGLIDLGGVLFPPRTPDSPDVWQLDCSEAERYSREYFDRLPGKLLTITYEVSEERDWFYYVADTTFMRAWLADPNFHMIK